MLTLACSVFKVVNFSFCLSTPSRRLSVGIRAENASLIAKIDKLNESIANLKTENASLISKARDLNVCNDSISFLRDENAILHAKIDKLNACKPSTSISFLVENDTPTTRALVLQAIKELARTSRTSTELPDVNVGLKIKPQYGGVPKTRRRAAGPARALTSK
jgi:cell division protein FtsB